jgi:5-methylcytosine-specific restriction enzyme subunit McrC
VTADALRTIELNEYAPRKLDLTELSENVAVTLWQKYAAQINVDFPSPKTDNRWVLTPQGWVGQIPLTRDLTLRLNPKTPVNNIFGMFEYAYRLRQFLMPEGMVETDALEDVFEHLAVVLSRRVIARARKGLYREYVAVSANLTCLRGRLDVGRLSRAPWKVELACDYSNHTSDIDDNRIVSWTLFLIGRAGLGGERHGNVVGRAFRALQGTVALTQYGPESCVDRHYNRLNEDYASIHALCRFFLSHTGPAHRDGEHAMLPFLIDMAKLYESFVAEWLRMHLPQQFTMGSQQHVICGVGSPPCVIDLVLYDELTKQPIQVLDTKYKAPGRAVKEDIYQIVTYAKLLNCREAVLVYPIELEWPLDIEIGDVRIRSLTFAIEGNLDTAGHAFLSMLALP